jgi:hypothetical protein
VLTVVLGTKVRILKNTGKFPVLIKPIMCDRRMTGIKQKTVTYERGAQQLREDSA